MHLVAPSLPWEFRANRKARAEHDVSSWAERAVATTEPPPLRSLLHQVRNGMRVIEDRSRCQLAVPRLKVETILRLPEALFPSCRLRQSPGMPRPWQFPPAGPYASSERFAPSECR